MSSLTLDMETQVAEIFEFSGIIENVKRSNVKAGKTLGDVGLSVTMPVALGTGIIKLKTNKRQIDKLFNKAFKDFQTFSHRDKMKFEASLVNSFEELESKLMPLLDIIESRSHLGSHKFIKEAKLTLDLIREKKNLFTNIVYPNRVDPATNSEMFKELVEAYKGVNLSDWKLEIITKKIKAA